MKLEPRPLTQEQKDWLETHMQKETRPYAPAKTFLKRIGCKEILQ